MNHLPLCTCSFCHYHHYVLRRPHFQATLCFELYLVQYAGAARSKRDTYQALNVHDRVQLSQTISCLYPYCGRTYYLLPHPLSYTRVPWLQRHLGLVNTLPREFDNGHRALNDSDSEAVKGSAEGILDSKIFNVRGI